MTESQCDAIANTVDRITCYKTLITNNQDLISSNQAAINADCGGGGGVLPSVSCMLRKNAALSAVSSANANIASLNNKINAIQSSPQFTQDQKSATQSRTIKWGIGIVIFIILIILAVHLYRKYKQG